MNHTIGTCSCCGGRVALPNTWASVDPPVPQCQKCGAHPKQAFGPIIEMEPLKTLEDRSRHFSNIPNGNVPLTGKPVGDK